MRKALPGYEGFYEICSSGQVYSLDRVTTGKHGTQRVKGKAIKSLTHPTHGYSLVNLAKNGVVKQYRVHILVAKAFLENPDNKPTVNHKSGIKSDNSADNLEWATHQEQMDHATELGLTAKGERNGGAKITAIQAREAFDACMAGASLSSESTKLGLNRNALPNWFKQLGVLPEWQLEAKRRKSSKYRKMLPNEYVPG